MLITRDHFVPHVSTVPANAGQLVGIHVREKVRARAPRAAAGRVVLFVHGVSVPSVPDFDLDYKTYNWMACLARAGFRVYAMDHTGYGGSPRPMMDDPSNVNPQQQAIITPRPLQGATAPNYPYQLNTIRDVVWKAIMQWDRVGASWGPAGGVMRVRAATRFGWTRELAAQVAAPTLVVVGEYDRLEERRSVYEQLGSKDKVFMNVACASHFMLWEEQHAALHFASKEWLTHGRLKDVRRGEMRVDPDGNFQTGAAAVRAK